MATATVTPKGISLRIEIPMNLADKYQQYSRDGNPETEIRRRLLTCVDHKAQLGIYLDDEQRLRLNRALAKNLNVGDDVVRAVEALVTVGVENSRVLIPADLLQRLRSRCFEKDFGSWLANLIRQELERYAQMR